MDSNSTPEKSEEKSIQEALPIEIRQQIFGYCSTSDLKAISQVCHLWKNEVEHLLLKRVYLKLFLTGFVNSTPEMLEDVKQMKREYTDLRFKTTPKDRNPSKSYLRKLNQLVDLCADKFPVRSLYLYAPPLNTIHILNNREGWLQNLVELHLMFQMTKLKEAQSCELTLPSLKELTWIDSGPREVILNNNPNYYFELPSREPGRIALMGWCCTITVNAPELSRLVVLMDGLTRSSSEIHCTDPDVCGLFLPALELKSPTKLENVTIGGLLDLSQQQMDSSEPFLRNVKELKLIACQTTVTEKICDKSPTLKELTIEEPQGHSMSLQISPALIPNLEKLSIKNWRGRFILNGPAVFPKLRYLCLAGENTIKINVYDDYRLNAPRLNTYVGLVKTTNRQVGLLHEDQVRSIKVLMTPEITEVVSNLPNLTDLHLTFDPTCSVSVFMSVGDYIRLFSNLKRLTLEVPEPLVKQVDYSFVEHLPNLEDLFLHGSQIEFSDLDHFATLKSLILSKCIINSVPDGEEVLLTALEHFRVYNTSLASSSANRDGPSFPIRADEQQPPIEFDRESNAYSSRNFQPQLPKDCTPSLFSLKSVILKS